LALRMSSDCGSSWSTGVLDLASFGLNTPQTIESPTPTLLREVDRPEMYVDPFADRLFVSTTATAGGPPLPFVHVTWEGTPKSTSNPATIQWSVLRHDPWDGFPRAMTTVLDDRALTSVSPPAFGSRVHFASIRCISSPGIQSVPPGTPMLDVQTPFGRKEFNLIAGDSDPSAKCDTVPGGTNGMKFAGVHAGPSVVAIASTPPRFLVAYSGKTTDNFEVTNLFSVTLLSSNGYNRADITKLARLVNSLPTITGHVVFPHLITADNLAGSDLRVDAPAVLRVTTLSGDTVLESAMVIYGGLLGPVRALGTWSLSTAFPGVACPGPNGECFIGDYRYGSLIEKDGNTLKFFLPWIGGNPTGGAPGVSVHASMLSVSPH